MIEGGKYRARDDTLMQTLSKRPRDCEHCGAELKCPDPDLVFELTGRTLKCPVCGWHLGNEP